MLGKQSPSHTWLLLPARRMKYLEMRKKEQCCQSVLSMSSPISARAEQLDQNLKHWPGFLWHLNKLQEPDGNICQHGIYSISIARRLIRIKYKQRSVRLFQLIQNIENILMKNKQQLCGGAIISKFKKFKMHQFHFKMIFAN